MFGLKQRDIANIKYAVSMFPEIESVIIFGSRALGNYKEASDIDIAIKVTDNTLNTASKLSGMLNEELPIPFFVDVINIAEINNYDLLNHIKEKGIILD